MATRVMPKKMNASSMRELQNCFGGLSEDDCMLLIEEYGTEDNDNEQLVRAVCEALDATNLSTVPDLVWNLRENPCFPGRKSKPLNENRVSTPDSWLIARSRSSSAINKHVSGLPLASQHRPASTTAQMELNEGAMQTMPFSSSRNPIQILRTPKNVEPSQLRTYLSKYMHDIAMSNFLHEIYENQHKKLLILMRGASGSGKSTLASLIWAITERGEICSADHFFIGRNGQYRFDRNSLGRAHETCRERCQKGLERGDSPVIIDNTNTRTDEMMPYVEMAIENNYAIKILEPNTEWKKKPGLLFQKTIHNVPKRTIEDQLERFEQVSEKSLIDKALKRTGRAKGKYKPTQELDWGPTSSSTSPLESWGGMTNTLNSIASPTTATSNVFQFQQPKTFNNLAKSKTTPSSPHIQAQPQPFWGEPIPVRPPSPLLLSALLPELKNGTNDAKKTANTARSKRRKSGNGNGNAPPAGAASLPVPASTKKLLVFEDPAHADFNRLLKLFPREDKDKLEGMFNKFDGDIDECAYILINEGAVMSEPDENLNQVLEVTPPDETKPVAVEKFEDLLRWDAEPEDVTGASGSSSDPQAKQAGGSIADCEELESIPYDMNYENAIEAEAESGIQEDDTDTFDMVLPLQFARMLLSAYGHPEDEQRSLTQDELSIKIGADTAFELYKCLYINMHKAENESPRDGSEDSTRSSSPISTASNVEDEFDEIAISLSQMELETSSRDPQLASIMDIEAKIHQHMQESLRYFAAPNRTMAQNIKFCRLKQEYPNLDDAVIDEIYSQCFLDDEKTRGYLREMYPTINAIPNTPAGKSQREDNSWGLKYNPKDIKLFSQDELKNMHRAHEILEREWLAKMSKMKDYHQKCKNTGDPKIKAHYFSEAKAISERMKALSEEMQYYKAISLNAKHKNDQILDLHGLKIDGAMRVLKEFLQFKADEFVNAGIPKMILLIITGQGKHSRNGYPVIQPAVRNFLLQTRYKFHSSKPGTYTVIFTRGSVVKRTFGVDHA